MKSPDDIDTQTAERRRAHRQKSGALIRLKLDGDALEGEIDNISKTGVLLYTEGDLHVNVEVIQDGQKVLRKGKLVRMQRMRAGHVGWAIEFD